MKPTMLRLMVALLIALMSASALSQTLFRWTDDEGEVHYGHSVPSEYVSRGYERIGPDGRVRERVERELTDEERDARDARRALEAEEEAERRSQETRDRLLLAAYNSAEDITQSLDMQLMGINSQRSGIESSLEQQSDHFESLVRRAASRSRDGESVPDSLNRSIEQARAEVRRLRQALRDLDEREQSLRERYANQLERYLELTGEDG